MSGTSESTGVYVHQSRFPLKVLRRLVAASSDTGAGPEHASYVRRLTPLFVYEPNCTCEPQTSYNASPAALPSVKGKERENIHSSTSTDGAHEVHKPSSDATGLDKHKKAGFEMSDREILTFESPVEGLVVEWNVKDGDMLKDPFRPLVRVLEPCKHPVQLGGLCAVCGKDLTSVDYSGFSDTSRASVQMLHDTALLTVSMEEAARLEQQTATRLLKEQKLSLIVDLDQTVIQTAVDPTVGEWQNDPKNPNHPVLRDVQKFRLANEKGIPEGCWYYVKPRPKFQTFLDGCSKLYEMHVYTMATRAYAENVCRIIDPDGRIFGNRILSRDESGSQIQKSVERLFPVDQSMVVIIDDRADVWNWSPNLVKVIPYEFFPAIGDINGAFLPKPKGFFEEMAGSAPPLPAASAPASQGSVAQGGDTENQTSTSLAEQISEQNEAIDYQIQDKPLARMQEEKSERIHHEKEDREKASRTSTPASFPASAPTAPSPTPSGGSADVAPQTLPDSAQTVLAQPNENVLSKSPPMLARLPQINGIGSSRFVLKNQVEDHDSEISDDSGNDTDAQEGNVERPHPISPEGDYDVSPETGVSPDHTSRFRQQPLEQDEETTDLMTDQEEAVLHDDDVELDRVLQILQNVHARFYDPLDAEGGAVPVCAFGSLLYPAEVATMQVIIPRIKSRVLRGCNLIFSSLIPLDQIPERAEVWQLAEQFGAVCSSSMQNRTTHLVAGRPGTSKVHAARRRGGLNIVKRSWLEFSVARWAREDEAAHLWDTGEDEIDCPVTLPSPSAHRPTPDLEDHGEIEYLDPSMLNEGEQDRALQDIDWGDAAAEIDAFLDETDSEDDGSPYVSMDEGVSESEHTTGLLTHNRKRSRRGTMTPPESREVAQVSPLSKRRKVAAARAGKSKLKMSQSVHSAANDSEADEPVPVSSESTARITKSGESAAVPNNIVTSSSSSNSQASSPALRSNHGHDNDLDDDDLDEFAAALEGEMS